MEADFVNIDIAHNNINLPKSDCWSRRRKTVREMCERMQVTEVTDRQQQVRHIVHIKELQLNWCLGKIQDNLLFLHLTLFLSTEGGLHIPVPGNVASPAHQDGWEGWALFWCTC